MRRLPNKISKYKKKSFPSETAYNEWVLENSKFCLTFKENEFAINSFFVDSEGEILHSNINQKYWRGKFINLLLLEINWPIEVWNNDKRDYVTQIPLILKHKVVNG
ncbi:MAG: hypothetical protein LBE82_09775 [Chitinophagaceae bacterium]|jgi:hypothetical protein|nr:hypothetical protein [Chitinophagaceae bacterium]